MLQYLRHTACVCQSLCVLWLAGCQISPMHPSIAPQTSRSLPSEVTSEKGVRYEVLPDHSDIRFLVCRAGPLAKLGHNHVIQAKNIRGEINLAQDVHQSGVFIEIPVKDFLVDDSAARLDEGQEFFPQPDEEAVAGTARNMLGEKMLNTSKFPMIEIRAVALKGPVWGMDIMVRIKMHGREREMVVPTAVEKNGDTFVVTAFFSINQTDFGITPMRVFGEGLQVADAVGVRMRLVAGRMELRSQ